MSREVRWVEIKIRPVQLENSYSNNCWQLELRKEMAGLPDDTAILIDSVFEKQDLLSCIASKAGDVNHQNPYLVLVAFGKAISSE